MNNEMNVNLKHKVQNLKEHRFIKMFRVKCEEGLFSMVYVDPPFNTKHSRTFNRVGSLL